MKASNWTVDMNHSAIRFKVRHLALSNVAGVFRSFKGQVLSNNEDFEDAKVTFEIETGSIDTNNPERDKHLKSPDFLDTEHFPLMKFSGVIKAGDTLLGDLTIRNTTKPVQLALEYGGTGKGRFGDVRAGFEVSGNINRKDYGLTWNLLTEVGSLVVGEEIKLQFDVELIKSGEDTGL
ncbi:Polyisoprenoid-binding protein YceI [Chitinophaga rupis]|uniref:Polyisoprenoid-binding protein YceI n=1 Tax=Chitinophaga rupis TaxID=573321 RepID=A0A1H7QY18_9BACT|nr:YceI family protein [Chitinophaga rupis]SEL52823.1 Polyisoprenoid-binding protein YceI [Chitinophaga rupis]